MHIDVCLSSSSLSPDVALVDSGSSVSLVHCKLLPNLTERPSLESAPRLCAVNGA